MRPLIALLLAVAFTACEKDPVLHNVEYRFSKSGPFSFFARTGEWVTFNRGGSITLEYTSGSTIGARTEQDSSYLEIYIDGKFHAMDTVPPIEILSTVP